MRLGKNELANSTRLYCPPPIAVAPFALISVVAASFDLSAAPVVPDEDDGAEYDWGDRCGVAQGVDLEFLGTMTESSNDLYNVENRCLSSQPEPRG
ncbi:hypothetical protein CMUS01_02395 [Colletotrichum musicola]|uniref:Uncharacterized protein n=1 Tax=Colletotrichum musicola TaxID=2175873 RepID=A0A8H6NV03_9PEZI|nr:hypothetical protein CMUS01_02395 [Colletotrichum musicola]